MASLDRPLRFGLLALALALVLALLAGCFYSLDGSLVKAHDGSADVADLDLPPDTSAPADGASSPDAGTTFDVGAGDLGGAE